MAIDKVTILFRSDLKSEAELAAAERHFDVVNSRVNLKDSLVIGRYSVLPFYPELERDLILQGSRLINSYKQHKYVADFEYYEDIHDLTPKTYFDFSEINDKDAPFIVKGKTNSRKFDWDKLMFAPTKRRAVEIACDLKCDSLLYQQDIIVRKFEKLNIIETGLHGMPMANEWRFFCLENKILSYGFYWSIAERRGVLEDEAIELVVEVMKRVKDKINFFVIDVAEKEDGSWIVIEMNDGQMSGLSDNDPDVLYFTLMQEMKKLKSIDLINDLILSDQTKKGA